MKYKIGDKVVVTGDHEFPDGTKGEIRQPPRGVISLVPNGEWNGPERTFITATGKHISYWIQFKIPTDDGSGDGPYTGAEISLENIALQKR
jgi:hypothetical protein